jgi:hypothetical protein
MILTVIVNVLKAQNAPTYKAGQSQVSRLLRLPDLERSPKYKNAGMAHSVAGETIADLDRIQSEKNPTGWNAKTVIDIGKLIKSANVIVFFYIDLIALIDVNIENGAGALVRIGGAMVIWDNPCVKQCT